VAANGLLLVLALALARQRGYILHMAVAPQVAGRGPGRTLKNRLGASFFPPFLPAPLGWSACGGISNTKSQAASPAPGTCSRKRWDCTHLIPIILFFQLSQRALAPCSWRSIWTAQQLIATCRADTSPAFTTKDSHLRGPAKVMCSSLPRH
jgi:hypothetical protein